MNTPLPAVLVILVYVVVGFFVAYIEYKSHNGSKNYFGTVLAWPLVCIVLFFMWFDNIDIDVDEWFIRMFGKLDRLFDKDGKDAS